LTGAGAERLVVDDHGADQLAFLVELRRLQVNPVLKFIVDPLDAEATEWRVQAQHFRRPGEASTGERPIGHPSE
jgi:hypothetical protein